MSSPCAMLMTPIRPNTMASPSAIRSRIDASEAPWNTVSTVRTSRLQRSICRMAWVAASRSAGEAPASAASVCSAGMASNEWRVPSDCAARMRTAASPCARRMRASASPSAWRTRSTRSLAMAAPTTAAPPPSAPWPSLTAAAPRRSPAGPARRPRRRGAVRGPPRVVGGGSGGLRGTAGGGGGAGGATPRATAAADASSGLLLEGTLVLDPVAALVRARVLRPRLRLDQPLGARDDLELAVLEDLADEHGAVGVVVVLVHLDGAARRRERLAVDGLADRIDVERLGLLDGLLPDVDAEVARLHRVVRHALGAAGQALLLCVLLERVHELLVVRVLDGLEVVPRREVADQRGGIHAAQLVLGHAVRHDRRVLASQTLIGELLVERHVAVAVDRRQHARAAARGEALDLADDRLVVLMAERRVLLLDVRGRHALGEQERAEDLVGGAREDVVRAQQVELLVRSALLRHQILGARDELLVRRGARVEDVLAALLSFVLHRVEQQPVVVLEDRQHRLAADRRPAAEHDGDLVLEQELLGLLREQVPVRRGVDDHGLDGAAHHTALGVDLVDGHQHDVAQRHFADGHRARQRVQDADLDRVLALGADDGREAVGDGDPGAGRGQAGLEEVSP